MAAAEFVRTDNVSDEIPLAAEVGIVDDQIAATGLAVALLSPLNVVAAGGQASSRCFFSLRESMGSSSQCTGAHQNAHTFSVREPI